MLKMGRIVGLALFAVLAFCMVAVSSAFAISEWLLNGNPIPSTAKDRVETEGLVTLLLYEKAEKLNEIHCEGIFDGFVWEKSDEITAILNSLQEELRELEDPNPLGVSCEVTFDGNSFFGCKAAQLVNVWPDNVSVELGDWWLSELLLVGTTFVDDLNATNLAGLFPGWEVECETLIGAIATNLCESPEESTTMTNNANGSVHGVFNELTQAQREAHPCSSLGQGEVLGEGDTWAAPTELKREAGLSVS